MRIRVTPFLLTLNLAFGVALLAGPSATVAQDPWKTCEKDTGGNWHCCEGCSMIGPDECQENGDCGPK